MKRGPAIVGVVLALILAFPVRAEPRQPLVITSDQLVVDDAGKTAVFTGKVEVVDGEMRLFADKMTVHYQDGADEPVREVVAEGHVVVIQSGRRGVADRGHFKRDESTFVLSGNARIEGETDRLQGERIVLHLNENREITKIVAEKGGSGRVKAFYQPSSAGGKEQR